MASNDGLHASQGGGGLAPPPLNDAVLSQVEPQWRDEFRQFIATGDASEDFLVYLDRTPACQRAVDEALATQLAALPDLHPALPLPREPAAKFAVGRLLVTGGLVTACLVLVLSLGSTLYLLSERQAMSDRLEANQALLAAYQARPEPVAELASAARTVNDLPRLLQHENPEVREQAIQLAFQMPEGLNNALPALVHQRGGEIGVAMHREFVHLQQTLSDMVAIDLATAASGLQADLDQQRDKAVKRLSSPDPAVRLGAAQTLGKMGVAAEAAVPPLIDRLKEEKDVHVRKEAVDALCRIDPEAAGRVGVSTRDSWRHALEGFEVALWQKELRGEMPGTRIRAAKELGDLGPRAAAALPALAAAYQEEKDSQVRWQLANALKQIDLVAAEEAGVPITPEEKALQSHPGRRQANRTFAAVALFGLGEGEPEDRAEAAGVLGKMGPAARETFPAVLEAYQAEKDEHVRRQLGQTLLKIDPQQASKMGIH